MNPQTRAEQLIAAGYRPVPVNGKQIAYAGDTFERDYAPEHFTSGTRIQIRAGEQKDGTFLCAGDLEGPSHGAAYDAEAERAALEAALPTIASKLIWVPSTSGDGLWPIFRTYVQLHSGQLYRDGRKIGDFIAVGGTCRVPDFGDQAPLILSQTEIELLLRFWTVASSDRSDGERWSDRAKEGKRYTAGWQREQVPDLAKWLRNLKVSDKAAPIRDELLDKLTTATRGERSTLAGRLARFILNHIHQLDTTGDFYKRCRLYKALWMQAKSYGKADENYNQDKDGDALLTQILYEDEMTFGGRWRAPAWMRAWLGLRLGGKTPIETPVAPPKRPAHRPVGDRDRMLAKIRHYFDLLAYEGDGMIYYHVDDLAERFGIARRTMQTYLADLNIERHQDPGPGGRAWLIWGADNSEKTAEIVAESPPIWGADESAIEAIQTPQNADPTPVCIEDHQDTCAPAPAGPAHQGRTNLGAPPREPAGERSPDDQSGASYNPKADRTRKRCRRSKLSPKETAASAKTRRRAKWRELAETDIELLKVERWKLSRKAAKVQGQAQRDVLNDYVVEIDHYLALNGSHRSRHVPTPVPEEDLPDLPSSSAVDTVAMYARLKARQAGAT